MEQNNKNTPEPRKKQSKRFLAVYIIGLFSVALVLILLSYLTQVRADQQVQTLGSQLTEQQNVASGAVQKMENLQNTLEEQKKQLDAQAATLKELHSVLGTKEEDPLPEATKLLQERYIALDALQQVRRQIETENFEQAKILMTKMIESYGEARLTNGLAPDSVLLGANSTEFIQYRDQLNALS